MPILEDYDQFEGFHWETGSLRNHLAYQGIRAPHNDKPYSEAMILGISGGITMGYYTFDYVGLDPMVRILTRNTFDPLPTIYKRLGINSSVYQTANADKGVRNLEEILESGSTAICYADMYSLPYNLLRPDEDMWAMMPILIYGYDAQNHQVWIADRSKKPLDISIEELAIARGRTKNNKYRLIIHEPPDPYKLKQAVMDGINHCVSNFTQPPPKGSKNNFGFLAYKKWVDLLLKPNVRGSWQIEFAAGPRMYAGLISAFEDIRTFGKNGGADRYLYADFLIEASLVLSKPALKEIAHQFLLSAKAWDDLSSSLLPDKIPMFKETRSLIVEKHKIFHEQGSSAQEEMLGKKNRLSELKVIIGEDFPINEAQAEEMRIEIAERVMNVMRIEESAIEILAKVSHE
jgi:hypothetical protein